MASKINIGNDLQDLLLTKNFDPKITNKFGQETDPNDGTTFSFDYVSSTGKNYGTAVIVLGDNGDLMLFFGDNLGRSMENPEDKSEWFDFMRQLKDFSVRHNFQTFTPKNLNQIKHTLAGIAAIKEGLFEGYYGTRKISYAGQPTEARLMIRHNQNLGENDARYRHVESLFIETVDGERFKLPFRSLTGGRAMLEHVRQGGKPYDVRGVHIAEMVSEIAVLSRFNRASSQRILEGSTQQLVTEAQAYYKELKESLKHLGSSRGYKNYFESWHPATIDEQQGLVEDIKTMFIEQTIDSRIEAALPVLAKIQRGSTMKEADIFESWINNLSEGTWALPDTPESKQKLADLLAAELQVGPDATNATEQLYDIFGDDQLFDALQELAKQDANADARPVIIDRMNEIGLEVPGMEPSANAEEPAGDPDPEDLGSVDAEQGVAEGSETAADIDKKIEFHKQGQAAAQYKGSMNKMHAAKIRELEAKKAALKKQGVAEGQTPEQEIERLKLRQNAEHGGASLKRQAQTQARIRELEKQIKDKKGVAEGTEEELDEALNKLLKLAQVPVAEARIIDESGETFDHILDRFKFEVKQFEETGELDDDLYEALFDYYANTGEMPYGTMKARTGDPFEWISQRLYDDLGLNEADPMSTFEVMSGFDAPKVQESGCNHTMEGEYCPEHGLAECGYMESMGGTVAGAVAPVMDEDSTDPMDHRGAVTDSFYEGELDRLKKLALGK